MPSDRQHTHVAMDLIINGTASVRSSLGARRYFEGVMRHLDWPSHVTISPLTRWAKAERLGELLDRGRPDALYWSPCHRGPMFAHRHVITILDCLNVEYVYRDDWRLPLFRKLFNMVLDNAVAVVAISQATGDAVLRNYTIDPAKLVVIPGPVDGAIWQTSQALDKSTHDTTADSESERPFVLMITNRLPHKNSAPAAEAFSKSNAARLGVSLRVVGAIDPKAIFQCEAAGVKIDVRKGVDNDTLDHWLATCEFLLAPSLDEGLDLPIAEALAHGTRVVCSDIAVHREFYDGFARFFDPLRTDAIITSLNEALAETRRSFPSLAWSPQSSFPDVANQYRDLFLRLAAGKAPRIG